ncbi:putative cyclic nucleotide-gated ion channel 15-like protein [Corchorus olitorius]|uniref:Cyclic nucleotide-gated ion channel 15-like protein n=1 Tax=Corchorus olitorius TaxID=93759 RepID=A0A1R3J9K9_9ROSI|nr:putative cyclic nucleotide-gated ion channel 15-like protein [Corchorus olitorius]
MAAAEEETTATAAPPGSLAMYAASRRLAASTRRGVNMHSGSDSGVVSSLQKPAEPDFSVDED